MANNISRSFGIIATRQFPSDSAHAQRMAVVADAVTFSETDASVTTTSAEVLAANTNRKGLLLINPTDTYIWIKFAADPVATSGAEVGFPVPPFGEREFKGATSTGTIKAIHAGSGSKRLIIQEW